MLAVGRQLREHGYSAAARSVLHRGLDWIEMQPWEGSTAYLQLVWKAEYLYELGRWEEALDLYEQYYEWLSGEGRLGGGSLEGRPWILRLQGDDRRSQRYPGLHGLRRSATRRDGSGPVDKR